jgi:REP element-mobilizing transposase RayT
MPHSHADLLVHAIFSTKERQRLLQGDLPQRLFPYMRKIARQLSSEIYIINGADDHVHLLISVPPNRALAEIMRVVKCNSSRWVRQEFPDQGSLGWQRGYAAFSVSRSNRKAVYDYIARQQVHHKSQSFMNEFTMFLRKHQVEYDERYIWA